MKLIPLKATSEFIDVKKQGLLTYSTDVVSDQEGIILSSNTGDYGLLIIDQVHKSGPVMVKMRPMSTPTKKYNAGEIVGYLAVF